MADLTWAEATGECQVMPFRGDPVIFKGAQLFPSRETIWAPMARRGFMILSMGRLFTEGSPERILVKDWGERMPEMIRVVVPLLPVYSRTSFSFGERPRMPCPFTLTQRRSSERMISTPSLLKQSTVERQSVPSEKPSI